MGLDAHRYMGPYIECTHKLGKRTEHVWGCTMKECKKHPKKIGPDAEGKFCSSCGSPNAKIPFQVDSRVNFREVLEDDDILTECTGEGEDDDSLVLLMPNETRPGELDLDDDVFHYDLRGVDMEADMEWLKKKYAKELEKLRGAYKTVEVKWGLHSYVH